MCIEDIQVHVRRTDGLSVGVLSSLRLAKQFDAFVTGVFVVPFDRPQAFVMAEAVAMEVLSSLREFEKAQSYDTWWMDRLSEHSVRGQWRCAQGDSVDVLAYNSRFTNLIVTEISPIDADAPLGWGVVERLVFGVGAPVLIVPDVPMLPALGERILIAWNGSAEAARAVHAAMPLLKQAKYVVVLRGEEKPRTSDIKQVPALTLEAYFEQHGVNAIYRTFTTDAQSAGASILASARWESADMIVMGAWGRSRLSELVLGGASRFLFKNSDIPLFVAH